MVPYTPPDSFGCTLLLLLCFSYSYSYSYSCSCTGSLKLHLHVPGTVWHGVVQQEASGTVPEPLYSRVLLFACIGGIAVVDDCSIACLDACSRWRVWYVDVLNVSGCMQAGLAHAGHAAASNRMHTTHIQRFAARICSHCMTLRLSRSPLLIIF